MNRPNAYLVMDGATIKPNVHGKCNECDKMLHGETAVVMQGYKKMEDGSLDETRVQDIIICFECF